MDKFVDLGIEYRDDDNEEEAYKCFLEASLNNHAGGCIWLANMYLYGTYPKRDYKKAFKYYKYTTDIDLEMWHYAVMFISFAGNKIRKDEEAMDLYIDFMNYLIGNEVWEACISFASDYVSDRLIPKDVNKAIELYSMAAEKGIEYGYDCIGEIYFKGKGIEKDYIKAYEFFEKSTGFSNIKTFYYGEMYRLGIVFEKNIEKAKYYYYKLTMNKLNEEYEDFHYIMAKDRLEELEEEGL